MTFDLIDIGANLTNKSFAHDLEDVLSRARAAGVRRMIVTGTSVAASRAAADLAESRDGLFSTAGVHPHDARTCDDHTLAALRDVLCGPRTVAVGECGLDYNRNYSPPPVQREWFEKQVELAAELGKPLFLHERDAADDFIAILSRHRDRVPRAVIHCFTGDRDLLRRCRDLDLHFGITGWICDERRGTHLRELVREIPLDRLMIETDAPYLLPRSLTPRPRSRRNEPAFLTEVLRVVAECLERPEAEVAARTTETAERFFALAKEP